MWKWLSSMMNRKPEATPDDDLSRRPETRPAGRMLDLQQTAGNRAAQEMIETPAPSPPHAASPSKEAHPAHATADTHPADHAALPSTAAGPHATEMRAPEPHAAGEHAVAAGEQARAAYFAAGNYAPDAVKGQALNQSPRSPGDIALSEFLKAQLRQSGVPDHLWAEVIRLARIAVEKGLPMALAALAQASNACQPHREKIGKVLAEAARFNAQ